MEPSTDCRENWQQRRERKIEQMGGLPSLLKHPSDYGTILYGSILYPVDVGSRVMTPVDATGF